MNDAMFSSTKVIVTLCLLLLGAFALSSPHVFKFLRHDRKQRPRGLKVRHDPKDAKFEIVAVHGLGADPEYTWTCKAESPESGSGNRVHLLDLLAKQFTNARIMNFAHSSDWLLDASKSTVQSTGVALGEHLVSRREKESSKLPIVFIGHSFGGLVIKEALDWLAYEGRWESNQKPSAANIIESTRGILFLGTPHRGSSLALWAYLLAIVTRIFASETSLLLLLLKDSGQLSDIANKFQTTRDRLNNAKIVSFYETKNTYFGFLPIGSIVDQESARGLSSTLKSIDTDHSGLNKCRGPSDQVFQEIIKAVESMTSLPPSLSRADKWILERYANDDRLWIQRISGERLPMDSCFVNLNIMKQNVRGGRFVDHVQPPDMYHSLAKRLGRSESGGMRWALRGVLQKHGDKDQISLPDLFNLRKFSDEKEERRPRRILIRGRPGVGKSTLCKKIISDFLQFKGFKNSMKNGGGDLQPTPESSYCSHFARILWVPLRNLAARHDKSCWDQILGMYFVPMETPEAESMAKALKDHLQNLNADDATLFLLDGMDEIAASLQDGSALKESVDWLLGQRNIIVTSRPSIRFDKTQQREKFDIELETVGFYQDQVKAYVEKVARSKAEAILDFLDRRPLIQELVRIPIQLDGLCFAMLQENRVEAWANMRGTSAPETMTNLYQAIERALWRKDAIRRGQMTENNASRPIDIENKMATEIKLLERLAFDGLQHHLTVFDSQFLNKWYSQLPKQLVSEVKDIDDLLQSLSFLRSTDVKHHESQRYCYFLHLTQQEYFAARHLRRQWIGQNAESVDARDFFRKNKYSEQFDIVWRFLSGLLGSHDDEKCSLLDSKANHEHDSRCLEVNHLKRYFAEIESEPLDMLGPAHQRLVIHCLHEVHPSLSFPLRETLEERLARWINIEFDFGKSASTGSHLGSRSLIGDSDCPSATLAKVIMTADHDSFKMHLLQYMDFRQLNQKCVDVVTTWMEKIQSPDLLLPVIAKFSNSPNLPIHVLRFTSTYLGSPDHLVLSEATNFLGKMAELCRPPLREILIHETTTKLKNSDEEIVRSALEVLGHVPILKETTLYAIVRVLEIRFRLFKIRALEETRKIALYVLAKHPRLPHVIKNKVAQTYSACVESDLGFAAYFQPVRKILQEPALLQVLENEVHKLWSGDLEKCSGGMKVLLQEPNLPESWLLEMTTMLDPKERLRSRSPEEYMRLYHAQMFASDILSARENLPEAVVKEVLHVFNDTGAPEAKQLAFAILNTQSKLSETVLSTLIQSLESQNTREQGEIFTILRSQPWLPETILQSLALNLEHRDLALQELIVKILQFEKFPGEHDSWIWKNALEQLGQNLEDPASNIDQTAVDILLHRKSLPQAILDKAEVLLENQKSNTRLIALQLLANVSDLSNITLNKVGNLLRDQNSLVRETALGLLVDQRDLQDATIDKISGLLEDQTLILIWSSWKDGNVFQFQHLIR